MVEPARDLGPSVRVVDSAGVEAPSEHGAIVLEEACSYFVESSGEAPIESCRVGGAQLRRLDDGRHELDVGHAVGTSALELESGGRRSIVRITLRPRHDKLDVDAWCALVEELDAWLPGVTVGISGGSDGGVSPSGVPAGLLAAATAPLVPVLTRAIETLLDSPKHEVVLRRDDRRMHTIRAVRSDTVRWLGRHRAPIVSEAEQRPLPFDPFLPTLIHETSHDHAANRAVRWYAEQVLRRVRPIADALASAAHGQLDSIAEWCRSKAATLHREADVLRDVLDSSFLAELAPEAPGPSALVALADDPAYARVLRVARRILGARFARDGDSDLPVPARATFELYELWTFRSVQRALDAALGPGAWSRPKVREHQLLAHDLHGLVLGRSFAGGELSLGYNLTFSSYIARPDASRVALTGERRPDLVICWRAPDSNSAWIVLDAKYRVSPTALKDAFQSLHVYRDALRWRDFGGRAKAGLLLVPNVLRGCEPWASSTFRAEHGLGLWELRPGREPDRALGTWLIETLGATRGAAVPGQ